MCQAAEKLYFHFKPPALSMHQNLRVRNVCEPASRRLKNNRDAFSTEILWGTLRAKNTCYRAELCWTMMWLPDREDETHSFRGRTYISCLGISWVLHQIISTIYNSFNYKNCKSNTRYQKCFLFPLKSESNTADSQVLDYPPIEILPITQPRHGRTTKAWTFFKQIVRSPFTRTLTLGNSLICCLSPTMLLSQRGGMSGLGVATMPVFVVVLNVSAPCSLPIHWANRCSDHVVSEMSFRTHRLHCVYRTCHDDTMFLSCSKVQRCYRTHILVEFCCCDRHWVEVRWVQVYLFE